MVRFSSIGALLLLFLPLLLVDSRPFDPISILRMPWDLDLGSEGIDEATVGTRWAVLIAGSSGYGNYRHQVYCWTFFLRFEFIFWFGVGFDWVFVCGFESLILECFLFLVIIIIIIFLDFFCGEFGGVESGVMVFYNINFFWNIYFILIYCYFYDVLVRVFVAWAWILCFYYVVSYFLFFKFFT